MSLLPGHGRFEYVPITRRRDFTWPGGKRLAVYFGVNLEHFGFGEGLGAELAPGGPQPDVLNYAWRDYGNRVGAWRMLEMFDRLDLPATVIANSAMYAYAPELMAAWRARGDEVAGHGRTNSERQSVLAEAEERALIDEATRAIAEAEGAAPKGWLSPWIAESHATPDLLAEAGYAYTMNWCMDDQPVWMRTRTGRILSIPYPQEINDIPSIVARKDGRSGFRGDDRGLLRRDAGAVGGAEPGDGRGAASVHRRPAAPASAAAGGVGACRGAAGSCHDYAAQAANRFFGRCWRGDGFRPRRRS